MTCPGCGERYVTAPSQEHEPSPAADDGERGFVRLTLIAYALCSAVAAWLVSLGLPLGTRLSVALGIALGFWLAARMLARIGVDVWGWPIALGVLAGGIGNYLTTGAVVDSWLRIMMLSVSCVVIAQFCIIGALALWQRLGAR